MAKQHRKGQGASGPADPESRDQGSPQTDSNATNKEPLESIESEAPELDPHLQQVASVGTAGPLADRQTLTETAEGNPAVDVLAKLKDPTVKVDGLNVIEAVGQIVTGTVEIDKIETVRSHPNVLSLKRATRLHQELRFSVPEIRADPAALQAKGPTGFDGSGVIVGIVDYGCDFLHRNFRKADGSTRVLFIWDQNGGRTSSSPQPYGYGREYTAPQINTAIQEASSPPAPTDPIYAQVKFPEDPNNRAYTMLGYGPPATPTNARGAGSHGTHVMDIASGNGRGSGAPGVAPGADIVFVDVSAGDVGPEESFGNSRRLVEAVRYIFRKAQQLDRPCVINISLGTHGGPHDGCTLVEQDFDQHLSEPGRAIVISAGNSWERRSHASGRITSSTPRTLTWQIGLPNQLGQLVDPTGNELEVWYPGAAALEVTLVTPNGQSIGPTILGRRREIKAGGVTQGLIIHRRSDSINGDNHVDILLSPSLPTGDWKVILTTAGGEVDFHSWIERDDEGQSRFAPQDDDRTHTLGSISCGQHTLTVGSYDARSVQKDLSPFTAEGPTRDRKQKPEISAPGHGVQAAWSLTHNRVTPKSGTSMAAPHVTGHVALIMQAAGHALSTGELRQAVIGGARTMTNSVWHARYGAGRIDTLEAIRFVVAPSELKPFANLPMVTAPAPAAANGGGNASRSPLDELFASLTHVAVDRRARIRLEIEVQPAETGGR